MDSLLAAAARALSTGDPLEALKRVALRNDAPSLALRGIAMAQMGELARAKELLRSAAKTFEPRERVARARCTVAAAEIALAMRELAPARALPSARKVLTESGDHRNALHASLIEVRRWLLLGRVRDAEASLAKLDFAKAPPPLVAVGELCKAAVAEKRLAIGTARLSLERAQRAARGAGVPALIAEVERALCLLEAPAARLRSQGEERLLTLEQVAEVLASSALVVDACRRRLRHPGRELSLARRPVLFALLRALGETWPDGMERAALIERAFEVKRPNESHRARLRVELGRLRRLLHSACAVVATPEGFRLAPKKNQTVLVLVPPIGGEDAALLALLSDGEAWSTSALSLALGASQRTLQRALSSLESRGQVRSVGRGRAQRWLAPPALGFTTSLLLPTSFTRS